MIPKDVVKMAKLMEFKPYTIAFSHYDSIGFFMWGRSKIKIYNLVYDDTVIATGGIAHVTKLMNIANAAFNLGISWAHEVEEID